MSKRYPKTPGWRGKGLSGKTSAEAAIALRPESKVLRRIALRTLDKLGAATRLEACEAAGVAPRQLEPRFSELKAKGHVEETGRRKLNPASRKWNCELRLTDAGRAAL